MNTPQVIVELLQSDSVYKNIRVHFPDGEHEDITNKDIVTESVKFSESLCSQNDFKLGLCESPSIEFETVGIGNIQGATIECTLEIDVADKFYNQTQTVEAIRLNPESTPAWYDHIFDKGYAYVDKVTGYGNESCLVEYLVNGETVTEYATHSDDGYFHIEKNDVIRIVINGTIGGARTLYGNFIDADLYYAEDIGRYVYPIKYGTFVVDSCKRTNEVTHRRVIAYGLESIVDYQLLEGIKTLSNYTWREQETLSLTADDLLDLYFPSYANSRYGNLMTDETFAVVADGIEPLATCYINNDKTQESNRLTVTVKYRYFSPLQGSRINLYRTDYDKRRYDAALAEIKDYLQTEFNSTDLTGFRSRYVDGIVAGECFGLIMGAPYTYTKFTTYPDGIHTGPQMNRAYSTKVYSDNRPHTYFSKRIVETGGETEYYRTDMFINMDGTNTIANNGVYIPTQIEVSRLPYSAEVVKTVDIPNRIFGYSRAIDNADGLLTLTSEQSEYELIKLNTATQKKTTTTRTDWTFAPQIEELFKKDLREIIQSYLELNGYIGKFDRDGVFKLVQIEASGALYPSNNLYPSDALYPRESDTIIPKSQYEAVTFAEWSVKPCSKIVVDFTNTADVKRHQEKLVPTTYEYETETVDTQSVFVPWLSPTGDPYAYANYTFQYSPDILVDGVAINLNGNYAFKSIRVYYGTKNTLIEFESPYNTNNYTIMDEDIINNASNISRIAVEFATLSDYGDIAFTVGEAYAIPVYDTEVGKTYDISNNWFIKNKKYTGRQIKSILDVMASSLIDIEYTPCTLTAKGRPDLECGDWLTVLTDLGGFQTVILERQITGVQTLRDNIVARGE